jgi:hypothetical protein
MNNFHEMGAEHPLLQALRNGLLWHCTSAKSFRQIHSDGFLNPVTGTTNRWGKRAYGCQSLGGICLFDFTSQPMDRILESANKWAPFVVREKPFTVIVGMDRQQLPGKLVPYPENRDISPNNSSGPIPWVEVCHCGPIPVSAFTSHVLVCGRDWSQFSGHQRLDEQTLAKYQRDHDILKEFGQNGEPIQKPPKVIKCPELTARMEKAKFRIEEMRKQK